MKNVSKLSHFGLILAAVLFLAGTPVAWAQSKQLLSINDVTLNDFNELKLNSVRSDGDGWIAIFNSKDDGTIGDVIGYYPLSAGYNFNVPVKFDTSLATHSLFAVILSDRGEVGKFEYPGADSPAMESDGSWVMAQFARPQYSGTTGP